MVNSPFGEDQIAVVRQRLQETRYGVATVGIPSILGRPVHGGHTLALGGEGHLGNAGHLPLHLSLPQAQPGCGHHQGTLGGIPDGVVTVLISVVRLKAGIVGQRAAGQ